MIENMDHVNIVVSDLAKSTDFFTQLGFNVLVKPSPLSGDWISNIVGLKNVQAQYTVLSLPNATTHLELIQYESPPSKHDADVAKANQIGFRHLAFCVSDIEGLVKSLQARNVTFMSPVQIYPKTGKKLVYFTGPDNILLEFAQYI